MRALVGGAMLARQGVWTCLLHVPDCPGLSRSMILGLMLEFCLTNLFQVQRWELVNINTHYWP